VSWAARCSIAFPPEGYKDIREYMTAHRVNLKARVLRPAELGVCLLRHCLAFAEVTGRRIAPTTPAAPARANLAAAARGPSYLNPSGDPAFWLRVPPRPLNECPQAFGVVMGAPDGRAMIFCAACQRLTCPFCGPLRRQQYRDTVRVHLDRERNAGRAEVFLFHVPAGDPDDDRGGEPWQTVSRGLQRSKAQFFRLRIPGDVYLCVATAAPRSEWVAQVQTVPTRTAAERLTLAIDQLAPEGKIFRSSRGWPILDDDENGAPQGYKKIGSAKSLDEATAILAAHRVGYTLGRKASTYKVHTFATFRMADVPDRAHLLQDLNAGEATPGVFTWGGFEGDDEGEAR
jgi:hypothetical protein